MNAPISSFKKFLKKQAPITVIPLAHKNVKPQASTKTDNTGNVDMSNGGLTDAMTEARDVKKLPTEHLERLVQRGDNDAERVGPAFGAQIKAAREELARRKKGKREKDDSGPDYRGPAFYAPVKESEQLDELAKTPMNTSKTEDLHKRLSKFYNIDAKDKEGIGIYQKFHNHINNALLKGAKGPEEKSKPDPVDPESQKTQADALAAGKKIDGLLGAHKSPSADFHVYAGLKHHPFENIKDEQGYDAGDEPVEAHMPSFAQASIDPSFAKQNAGKGGHVLKLQIKSGSKHGAYIGHVDGVGHDREFLVRPGRKLRINPKPEMHGDTHIWHGELQG